MDARQITPIAPTDGDEEIGTVTTAAALPTIPGIPLPLQLGASGLYEYTMLALPVLPPPIGPVIPKLPLTREELRLDVDGRFPLMVASGALFFRLTTRVHWVARLKQIAPNRYAGAIFYKDGDVTALPQTTVTIDVTRSFFPNQRTATVTFAGGGAPQRTATFRFATAFFRPCEFEYDVVQGTAAVTQFDTATHPNRPASLPNEVLTIQSVYQRAGINASVSAGGGVIPITIAGGNLRWSDAEMHDAMVHYWSRFANAPQWAAWVLFAAMSESGASLGGIMFDQIGPNHRQGTAIFEDSFINTPPAGDPHGAAFVQRMKFWTAVHEIGHTFNLAHSWQESLATPWIPLADEPLARTFMNYPYRVPGGTAAFFADFEYRFSDSELLFLRHAPPRFVEQGFAAWFDHHGFQQALTSPDAALKLELRMNRPRAELEFLEPVVLEMKLTNVSADPLTVDANVLRTLDHMTIATKRQGSKARVFQPFARYCFNGEKKVLMPGESLYESLFVSVGRNGWIVAEPGQYVIQLALHDEQGDIVSNPLMLRIAPPRGYDEEYLAQDVFTENVGRVLTFDGSRELTDATQTLQDAVDRLGGRRLAVHARIALAAAAMREYKSLRIGSDAGDRQIVVGTPAPDEAATEFNKALLDDTEIAIETLGHVDANYYARLFAEWLASVGRPAEAAGVIGNVTDAFQRHGVLRQVIANLRETQHDLLAATGVPAGDMPAHANARGPRTRR